ncbi:hypothetical protein RRG08_064135 [Elysia crispata]|uniref:Uncharacterized protein n=1 Tax=Elysia crispata TaxID=231223 RepID=A0AAE0ZN76_9GAST|nr:hypothetical protein RRG08_064135 [Elysia crispata]
MVRYVLRATLCWPIFSEGHGIKIKRETRTHAAPHLVRLYPTAPESQFKPINKLSHGCPRRFCAVYYCQEQSRQDQPESDPQIAFQKLLHGYNDIIF